MDDFELIRKRIVMAEQPQASEQRKPVWFANGERIAIARDHTGRFEIFLTVVGLQISSTVVRRYVTEDSWRRVDGREFVASRLVIPGDPHFVGVAALIVDELLRNGFESNPQAAFVLSEPLIEMALERAGVSDETVLGLLGELIVLEQALVLHRSTGMRRRVLDAWTGYQRASRDFIGDHVSVEVKATARNKSRHHISNLDQVSLRLPPGGAGTERLFLVSVGLVPIQASGRSIASQTERICDLLVRDVSQEEATRFRGAFLQCLRLYGVAPGGGTGYDHDSMRSWRTFSAQWEVRFLRIYDMEDDLILVPRRGDLEQFRHLIDGSIEFEIDLPDVVRGDTNPTAELGDILRQLFE